MRGAFIDTYFLLALVNSEDDSHQLANKLRREYRSGLVTTEYVLIETLDALVWGEARAAGIAVVRTLQQDQTIHIVRASTGLLEEGMQLFASRPDKQWGITDCISFIVMRQHGVTDALTADHHFEQAGFRALLRA